MRIIDIDVHLAIDGERYFLSVGLHEVELSLAMAGDVQTTIAEGVKLLAAKEEAAL